MSRDRGIAIMVNRIYGDTGREWLRWKDSVSGGEG